MAKFLDTVLETPPPGERKYNFDQPFLLYLKDPGKPKPMLMMWIETDELLEPVASKP